MTSGPTPWQTVGPFIAMVDWLGNVAPHVVSPDEPGAIWLRGTVVDGTGSTVGDAMIETWQADDSGRYPSPDDPRGSAEGFGGFARCFTDADGRWAVCTRKPAAVPGPGGAPQAPHVAVGLFARGLLQRLVTRLYFADEAEANAADPLLARLTAAETETLLAEPTGDGYHLDLRLQGNDATVFFDIR